MKKMMMGALAVCAVLLMSSCYTTSTYVGNTRPNQPMVEVQTVRNPHYLYGLIGESKMKASKMVDGENDYMVKHQMTFLDCVFSSVTFGIYTPTTTTFYVPFYKGTKASSKKNGKWDDDDEEDE